MLEEKIEQDLKTALLARDELKVRTLRGLKAGLLNVKVAKGKRESGLNDDEVMAELRKQAKQRQDSAEQYKQGNDQTRAEAELAEKAVIEQYLPAMLDEASIAKEVDQVITSGGATDMKAMGQIIGQVKSRLGGSADGAVIAKLVRDRLNR